MRVLSAIHRRAEKKTFPLILVLSSELTEVVYNIYEPDEIRDIARLYVMRRTLHHRT